MIRSLVKRFASFVMWVVSKLYPLGLSQRLSSKRNQLYTLWIRHFLGDMGECTQIEYPCHLQGGALKHIRIGHHTSIKSHVVLGCWDHYDAYNGRQTFSPEVIIGSHCYIGEYTQITACSRITIGDYLLTGRYVYIGDNSHGGFSVEESSIPPVQRELRSKGEIVIGNKVWIGDKATILSGVHIGNHVIVAANAVVLSDVPDNCMVAGVPARIVKQL